MNEENPLASPPAGISNTAIFRKIAFVGDSLSSGEFVAFSDEGEQSWYDMYEYSWGQYIARRYGLTAYNFSQGGMSAQWYIGSYAEEHGFWDPAKACQAYVIALGVNDVVNTGLEDLGSVEDIDFENPENCKKSFAGFYGGIVARYKKIQPEAKFFFVTMPRASYGDEKDADHLKENHARFLYELAEAAGNSYVIDLFKYAPVYDEEFHHKYFLYDHMNASGYIYTANMIDTYIDYIVRTHPDDFRRVPFIGTGLK